MKTMSKILLAVSLLTGTFAPVDAMAASLRGRVTRVATVPEYVQSGDRYHAQLRVRLSNSTCNGADTANRNVTIRSGRMDGRYAHNSANFRNVFDLLMSAYLSNKTVVIDDVPDCGSNSTINLWRSTIEIQ